MVLLYKSSDPNQLSQNLVRTIQTEPQVITVVLRVQMHCEACPQKIKKHILRMKGVQSAESDLRSSQVTVKGVFDPPKLVEYVYEGTGKHGEIVKQEPEKKEEKAEEADKEEKKKEEEGGEKGKEKENKAVEEETKEKKGGGGGEEEEAKPAAAPAPAEATTEETKPQVTTVVLSVHMHCEACAQEIKKHILRMKGVHSAESDLKSSQVTVKGVFDPPKLVVDVYKRTGKHGVIVKQEAEEKKQEPQVITVVLRVDMHCEACAKEIEKRILRMKGVQSAESDLKSSQVTVKGVFDPPKLVVYVYKRTGKHGVIVRQEPEKREENEFVDNLSAMLL